jgi:hypothetical protein
MQHHLQLLLLLLLQQLQSFWYLGAMQQAEEHL